MEEVQGPVRLQREAGQGPAAQGRWQWGAFQSQKQRKDTVSSASWNYPFVYCDTFFNKKSLLLF